ncbi:2-phospho-L-lactate guanylyltransferase [Microcella daejeonensis]|uniref:2-phospho-L-lactate guanylyltransferase n=1 Tax=Microcella daejeonensis TaxID=2994971 RepID=UPI00226E820F|nr:2-phospho-L-lactate guanylyltransferase [Microcella daejeonensis]WAB83821.1 2-phospho-L-lactate guanylyltransferase [Microcella daejeonensis]
MARPVSLVIPVRGGGQGKSRLAVAEERRARIAEAIALDTVLAARACAAVGELIVVGALPEPVAGVRVVPDPGFGLLVAIGAGLAICDADAPTAVLLGDLPALHPADLESALLAASEHSWAFVPDAEGSGTALVVAAAGLPHSLRFGPGSAEAHAEAGYVDLTAGLAGPPLTLTTLRRDVDTLDDLEAARALGLGARTTAALADG